MPLVERDPASGRRSPLPAFTGEERDKRGRSGRCGVPVVFGKVPVDAAQVRAFILAGALELDLIERMRRDLMRLVSEWDGPA